MRRIVTVTAVLVMCAGVAFSAFSKNDAGTSSGQMLKLGAGARAAGMGEAFAAVADNADSIYWNPAGLNRVEGKSLSVMHAAWFEGVAYDWASYAQKLSGIGTVGVGVQYLSYGSITGTDDAGIENGSFSPNDLAVSLAYGAKLGGVDLGVNGKYISSKIKNTATAFALDFGALLPVNEKVSLGAAVQNLGTGLKYVSKEESLPMNVRAGGSYLITPAWKAALDVIAPVDNVPTIAAGTEYWYSINEGMGAAGRLGYNTRANDTGGMNGISAGLGFRYQNLMLDYAFVPYGDLGNTHRVSFGVSFK